MNNLLIRNMKKHNQKYQEWLDSGKRTNIITFFTPTYNRASLISRAYDCLLMQTDKRFVWILINDGSKDNTIEIALELLNRNEFPILFVSKENGGKHSAFETAFKETLTEFFICMDDDDIYYPNAVETFLEEWKNIDNQGLSKEIGAIRVLTQEEDGTIVSRQPFDKSLLGKYIDQTTLESYYIKHEHFENWTCYRTDALRTIDIFPKGYWMSGKHKFFSESIWQGRFARKYKCRYFFVVLREYRHDTETSIIRSNKNRQHYIDMFINFKMILDEQQDYMIKSPKEYIFNICLVSILRIKLRVSLKVLLAHTPSLFLKILYTIISPFAFFVKNPKIGN